MHKIYAYISAFLILATGVSFAHATTIFSHTDHNDSLGWISRGNWDVYSYVASSSLADIFNPITETTLWLAVSTGTLPVDSVSIYDGYSDGYQIEGGIGGNIQTNKDVITTTPQKIRFQGTSFPSSDFIHNYFRFSLGNFSAQYPTSTPGGGRKLILLRHRCFLFTGLLVMATTKCALDRFSIRRITHRFNLDTTHKHKSRYSGNIK